MPERYEQKVWPSEPCEISLDSECDLPLQTQCLSITEHAYLDLGLKAPESQGFMMLTSIPGVFTFYYKEVHII